MRNGCRRPKNNYWLKINAINNVHGAGNLFSFFFFQMNQSGPIITLFDLFTPFKRQKTIVALAAANIKSLLSSPGWRQLLDSAWKPFPRWWHDGGRGHVVPSHTLSCHCFSFLPRPSEVKRFSSGEQPRRRLSQGKFST